MSRRPKDAGGLNIDLHTHSNCSDGSLSPGELVVRAAAAGVEVLALTDHDTVAGLEQAGHSAATHRLTLVPGVEISASWRAQGIHVLGLWIDPYSEQLRAALAAQGELRRSRMRKICAKLGKAGLPGAELLAAVEAHPGLPTRAHLANAMVAAGHVNRADEAFRAVRVPAGAHQVSFRFEPMSLRLGLVISGLALMGLVALGVWSLQRTAPATSSA